MPWASARVDLQPREKQQQRQAEHGQDRERLVDVDPPERGRTNEHPEDDLDNRGGMRSDGRRSTSSGAATAMAMTTASVEKEISGLAG
jgi:hypothetical protein